MEDVKCVVCSLAVDKLCSAWRPVVKLVETYVSGESQFLCYVLSELEQQIKKKS